jgi:hypothetical protein
MMKQKSAPTEQLRGKRSEARRKPVTTVTEPAPAPTASLPLALSSDSALRQYQLLPVAQPRLLSAQRESSFALMGRAYGNKFVQRGFGHTLLNGLLTSADFHPLATDSVPRQPVDEAARDRRRFVESVKIAVWPIPVGDSLVWGFDPFNLWLCPYSDETNPGLEFSTYFVVAPASYLDRSGNSPVQPWPLDGKMGSKFDFFLEGAHDFDLKIELHFQGLAATERPVLTRTIHIKDARPAEEPEIPEEKEVEGAGGAKQTFVPLYKVVRGELFVAQTSTEKKVRPEDIRQGQLGTCYFLASLGAVARDHPDVLERMIKDNRNGTYTVTFFEDKNWFGEPDYRAVPVTVDSKLPFLTPGGNLYLAARPAQVSAAGPELWVAVVEKAYAKWKKGYEAIEGGQPVKALPEITGVRAEQINTEDLTGDELLTKLHTALALGHPIVGNAVPSFKEWLFDHFTSAGEEARKRIQVAYSHTYTLMEADVNGRRLVLRNPWGFSHPELPVEIFRDYFKTVVISAL